MPDFTIFFFFFNDTATTEIYTLSLHDALPIFDIAEAADDHDREGLHDHGSAGERREHQHGCEHRATHSGERGDRKSTRLNSSHLVISYAVFCLKKKKKNTLFIRYTSIPPELHT